MWGYRAKISRTPGVAESRGSTMAAAPPLVAELRAYITERFQKQETGKSILVSCVSFGFRHARSCSATWAPT